MANLNNQDGHPAYIEVAENLAFVSSSITALRQLIDAWATTDDIRTNYIEKLTVAQSHIDRASAAFIDCVDAGLEARAVFQDILRDMQDGGQEQWKGAGGFDSGSFF